MCSVAPDSPSGLNANSPITRNPRCDTELYAIVRFMSRWANAHSAPYTIPHDGPTGAMVAACHWHPWRPAHIHLIVEAPGHEALITQLFFEGSEYLDGDVAGAVKEDLVVRPVAGRVQYDFALAPAEVPLAAA